MGSKYSYWAFYQDGQAVEVRRVPWSKEREIISLHNFGWQPISFRQWQGITKLLREETK